MLDQARCGERLDHVVAAVADADEGQAQRPVGRGKAGLASESRAGKQGQRTASEGRGQELAT